MSAPPKLFFSSEALLFNLSELQESAERDAGERWWPVCKCPLLANMVLTKLGIFFDNIRNLRRATPENMAIIFFSNSTS